MKRLLAVSAIFLCQVSFALYFSSIFVSPLSYEKSDDTIAREKFASAMVQSAHVSLMLAIIAGFVSFLIKDSADRTSNYRNWLRTEEWKTSHCSDKVDDGYTENSKKTAYTTKKYPQGR